MCAQVSVGVAISLGRLLQSWRQYSHAERQAWTSGHGRTGSANTKLRFGPARRSVRRSSGLRHHEPGGAPTGTKEPASQLMTVAKSLQTMSSAGGQPREQASNTPSCESGTSKQQSTKHGKANVQVAWTTIGRHQKCSPRGHEIARRL